MAETQQRQLAYWLEQLEESQPAELLCDKPRPAISSGKAQVHHFALDGRLHQELQTFCQTHQTTPFVVLLAAFRVMHYRLTGVDDATIGTPVPSNTNLLCIRTIIEPEDSFHALVQQVQQTNSVASSNQDVAFQKIVSELRPGTADLSRNPLVRTTFAVHPSGDSNSLWLDGVTVATSNFDIECHLVQEAQCMSGHIIFSDDLFEASSIRFVESIFTEVLARGLQTPEVHVSKLQLTQGLSALADLGLLEVARTDYPRDSSVVELFRRQVSLSPDAIAVKNAYSSSQLTYAELDRQSDQLAHWLVQRGLAPEAMVAVLAPRSCETIVALLAILKADLAYLPLDVNIPFGRLESILSEIQGDKLVFLGAGITPPALQLKGVSFRHIAQALDEQGPLIAGALPTPTASSLAYVLFTSGSTGKPKGVQVEHRGIVRLVRETNVASKTQSSGNIAHITNLAFDTSTWEIYAALLNGGTLICIDYMSVIDPITLGRVLQREAVQSCMLTPALLKQCLATAPSGLSGLELLFSAGDRLDPRDAVKAKGIIKGDLVNAYGPTENTTFSTVYNVPANENFVNSVPIGVAISNSGAFVMDPEQRLVPPGVMGELIVTGDGLARGYTNAELNKERFVQVDIHGKSIRGYRTGDRVRQRPSDGMIEFFGRMDFQVKVRGHRIELPEIEHALLRNSSVSDAVTLVYQPEGEPAELVSFVTVQGENTDAPAEHKGRSKEFLTNKAQVVEDLLKTELRASLPKYMIPARIAVLDNMPINANGKVDRKQLARLASTFAKATKGSRQIAEPRTALERAVCEELSSVLNLDAVGITDNFFDLGGHSLTAPCLVARINQRLNATIHLRDVFAHPVVADLARKVGESLDDSPPNNLGQESGSDEAFEIQDEEELLTMPLAIKLRHFNSHARPQCVKSLGIASEDIEEVLPATGIQTRMLVFVEEAEEMNITKPCIEHFVYHVPQELDPARLEQTIVDVTKQHDAFRTVEHPLSPYAQCILNPVHPRAQLPMVHSVVHEYDTSPDSLWEQTIGNAQRSAEEYIRPDRVGAVFQVVRTADNKHHVFIFSLFHLIYDGMSFDFLRRLFAQAYEGVPSNDLPAVGMRFPVEEHYSTDWLATSMYWMKHFAGATPFKAGQTVLKRSIPRQFTSIRTTQDTACEILDSSISLNELFFLSKAAKFPSPMAVVQGAWAMTLAQTLVKDAGQERSAANLDVQFGSSSPTRITFADAYKGEKEGGTKKRTHREICQELFMQYVDSLAYSEMPCPTVDFAKLTRRFDNTIILQTYPKEEAAVDASRLARTSMETLPGFTREEHLQTPWKESNHGYPILMELWPGCDSEDEKLRLRCTYNRHWPGYEFMTQEWAQGLLLALSDALDQILHNPEGEFDPVRLVEARQQ
ncbi:AMP-dependent synthetase/ligase [Penicillium chermesinum]|uniref:AMP-dependent synthetase/ligase n=1 Tax=Penicillium chermesinum TaxID=63820 RepID=A0A9W9P7Z9_9EURO|nr:AMP-dependent synthetase/ligase [Penicillium chermesinum]KAJ5239492.1 AMP-dependent synthetase/ligase [Penicillium chermesinum]